MVHLPNQPFFFGGGGGAGGFFFPNKPPKSPPLLASSGSTHPSSTYFPRRSNRSPPSNSGIPNDAIGNGIPPLIASFDKAFAFLRFSASIFACSAAGNFLLMYLDTLARRSFTSFDRFAPDRRFFRISCCRSYIGSRPPMSLLFCKKSKGPARGVVANRFRWREEEEEENPRAVLIVVVVVSIIVCVLRVAEWRFVNTAIMG